VIDIDALNAEQYEQMFAETESNLRACPKCGAVVVTLHRDHIIPRSKGGTNDKSNIQLICANCHDAKTKTDLADFYAKGSGMKGKTHSAETRAKMSAAQFGRSKPRSVEHQANLSAALTGRSAPNKGIPHTEEARAKMKAAWTRRLHESEAA